MNNDTIIRLFITGDFCLRGRGKDLLNAGRAGDIVDISPFLDADYRITNLEAPLIDQGKPSIKSGPSLQNPVASIHALKKYGFNLLCLANNHLMDYGQEGLESTLSICAKNHMSYVGAGRDLEHAAQPFIIKKGNYSLAILNMAENEFGEAASNRPGFYAYDPIDAFHSINNLKGKVDDILIIFHGGHEHYALPSPDVQKRYRYLIDAGASAVIAHHTHCFSGYEKYNGGLIVYSLGNFIFDHPAKRNDPWNRGMAIQLAWEKNEPAKLELHPYTQFDSDPKVGFLSGKEKESFLDEIEQLNKIIKNENALQEHWNEYLKMAEKKYLTYIEVPNHRYLRGARYYRLLPGWLTRRHKALVLNLMRCESHREIMRSALHKSIQK